MGEVGGEELVADGQIDVPRPSLYYLSEVASARPRGTAHHTARLLVVIAISRSFSAKSVSQSTAGLLCGQLARLEAAGPVCNTVETSGRQMEHAGDADGVAYCNDYCHSSMQPLIYVLLD